MDMKAHQYFYCAAGQISGMLYKNIIPFTKGKDFQLAKDDKTKIYRDYCGNPDKLKDSD